METSSNDNEPTTNLDELEETLNKYYNLKSSYETKKTEKKKEIKKLGLSKKEMRDMYRKFTPKCISCNRAVGSLFETKTDKSKVNTLIAKCGDNSQPCQLDIEIKTGDIVSLIKEKREQEEEIENIMNQIIIKKNDELFGYISEEEVIQNFERLKKELDDTTDYYRDILISYSSITDSFEKRQAFLEAKQLLNVHIASIKNYTDEYEKTRNSQFLIDVVDLYNNEMRKNLNTLNSLKYKHMSVEQDPTTGEYILKQTHYDKQELLMHGEYEIISYKIGKQLTTNNQNEGNTGAPMQQAIPDDIMDMSARAAMEDDMSEEYHPISDDESLSSEQLMYQQQGLTGPQGPFLPFTPPGTPPSNNTPPMLYDPVTGQAIMAPGSPQMNPMMYDSDSDTESVDQPALTIGAPIDITQDPTISAPPNIQYDELFGDSEDSYIPPPPPGPGPPLSQLPTNQPNLKQGIIALDPDSSMETIPTPPPLPSNMSSR